MQQLLSQSIDSFLHLCFPNLKLELLQSALDLISLRHRIAIIEEYVLIHLALLFNNNQTLIKLVKLTKLIWHQNTNIWHIRLSDN